MRIFTLAFAPLIQPESDIHFFVSNAVVGLLCRTQISQNIGTTAFKFREHSRFNFRYRIRTVIKHQVIKYGDAIRVGL